MTGMYKKVVIPLDGSPLAEVAMPYAEEVAGKMGCEIVLLSVLSSDEPEEYQNNHKYTSTMIDTTRRQVEKYLGDKGNKGIKIGAATRVGNPAEGILDYVDKGHMCLLVMATHGRSGVGRWAVGSVADKVVRATMRQPLLLIRAKGAHPDVRAKRILKKALVPLDGSTESESVIPYLNEVAQSLQMELTLLRVISKNNGNFADADAYLQGWCRRFKENGITAGYEVRPGSPAEQIIDLADEFASDMVAMSTRGQTAINLWSLGSVAQKVLLGGNTPLLLIRS
jgi:nucleotide-binding universal stress UspA family protein